MDAIEKAREAAAKAFADTLADEGHVIYTDAHATEITYNLEPVEPASALPPDVRAKLQRMAAEHMQAFSDALLASMWPKPAIPFEESVWPPEAKPRCACGKCYGIINTCGAIS